MDITQFVIELNKRLPDIKSIRQLELIKTELSRKYHVKPNNYEIRKTAASLGLDMNMFSLVKVKASRSKQGVLVLTVVFSPELPGEQDNTNQLNYFSCKYNCSYCPNVPGYARSYYPGEPAVDRGKRNNWDVIDQVNDRLNGYKKNGILNDYNPKTGYKLDVIIEGGTYTSFPKSYRMMFIHKLFYACNIYTNDTSREMLSLDEEQKINETSNFRIIGLSIETRPDTVNKSLIKELRKLGVTRVQIGIQSLDDNILSGVNRGCTVDDARKATKTLFDNAFKVAVHYMPDLPGSTMESDIEMWDLLFNDPSLEFDYVKVYPCMTLPYTDIDDWHREGRYKPYAKEMIRSNGIMIPKIVLVCAEFYKRCKSHQRIERMLRDLPVSEVTAGANKSNLRQQVIDYLETLFSLETETRPKVAFEIGRSLILRTKIREIRYNEVRDQYIDWNNKTPCMNIETYPASGGKEYFISYTVDMTQTEYKEYIKSKSDGKKNIRDKLTNSVLLGFIRLRIPDDSHHHNQCIEELENVALIREIHVYGEVVPVGDIVGSTDYTQHRGFGKSLLAKAEEIAKQEGYDTIAVISGVGVKEYYRKHGFYDGSYYLLKHI